MGVDKNIFQTSTKSKHDLKPDCIIFKKMEAHLFYLLATRCEWNATTAGMISRKSTMGTVNIQIPQ